MLISRAIRKVLYRFLKPLVLNIIKHEIIVYGDPGRCIISKKAHMVNTLFNTASGKIVVDDYTFAGHNVSIITGTHDYNSLLEARMNDIPSYGRDVIIGKGCWLGSNATILGPCVIGDHSVIAAGSVVVKDIPPFTIVGGVPAKVIKTIAMPETE